MLWAGFAAGAVGDDSPLVQASPNPITVAFTRSCFQNINRSDGEASFKVFLEALGRKRGYVIRPITRVFEDPAAFEAAIQEDSIQIAIMDSWQFLTLDVHRQVRPYFVPAEQGKVGKQYLLLTRQGSGLDKLADLRGKGLLRLTMANASLGEYWLETVLAEAGLGRPDAFFGNVEVVGKPTAAVLPVFFDKKACCLVDRSAFEVMVELNPQVKRGLQTVAESRTYLDILVCLGDKGWPPPRGKEDGIAALSELHLEPAGQQILSLFKLGQFVPFEDKQLETVRQLWTQRKQAAGAARAAS